MQAGLGARGSFSREMPGDQRAARPAGAETGHLAHADAQALGAERATLEQRLGRRGQRPVAVEPLRRDVVDLGVAR